jgi:hypothetical protein
LTRENESRISQATSLIPPPSPIVMFGSPIVMSGLPKPPGRKRTMSKNDHGASIS